MGLTKPRGTYHWPMDVAAVLSQRISDLDQPKDNRMAWAAVRDYVAQSGSVTIPAGQTYRSLSITITGDSTLEPDETFAVQLTATVNGHIARSTSRFTAVVAAASM